MVKVNRVATDRSNWERQDVAQPLASPPGRRIKPIRRG